MNFANTNHHHNIFKWHVSLCVFNLGLIINEHDMNLLHWFSWDSLSIKSFHFFHSIPFHSSVAYVAYFIVNKSIIISYVTMICNQNQINILIIYNVFKLCWNTWKVLVQWRHIRTHTCIRRLINEKRKQSQCNRLSNEMLLVWFWCCVVSAMQPKFRFNVHLFIVISVKCFW